MKSGKCASATGLGDAIKRLAPLSAYENVYGAAIVGSAASKDTKSNNIDTLLIVNRRLDPVALRKLIYKGNRHKFTISLDAIIFDNSLSIVQFTPTKFDSKSRNLLTGKSACKIRVKWSKFWWIPEEFCNDIKNAKIIFDKLGVLHYWKAKFYEYPPLLRNLVIAEGIRIILKNLKIIKGKEVTKGKSNRCAKESLFELYRITFALKSKYGVISGLKSIL